MTSYLHIRAAMAPALHHARRNFRRSIKTRQMSVYGFGQQWTGALSRGPSSSEEEALELSPEELQQFGEVQNMLPLKGLGEGEVCVGASAGWGHTALLVSDNNNKTAADDDARRTKLMVCGRPHDFQTLMRLRRLPPFVRNFCIKHTLPSEDKQSTTDNNGAPLEPSVMQRVASYFAGENEVSFHEDEFRRYSNIPTLLEIELPGGEVPAIEDETINASAHEVHASRRVAATEDNEKQHQQQQPVHTTFQNTLAASAGITALISQTGTLYTFGLNHRGQCGTGSFSPNIWTPSRVSGLASTRFILDHHHINDITGGEQGDMFREFREQQHPIVSVALGLQHGVALDSEGQVFCWGKGERGQLGQGRRMAYEGLSEEDVTSDNNDRVETGGEPNENMTIEYAVHVPNFYDPYATISSSSSDIYAPLLSLEDSKVRLISAGMNFTVAITDSNLPYIWGKNICLNPNYSNSGINIRSKPVLDSTYPRYIPGLPSELRIERVACGTHHAAMLLEDGSIWAVGIATDRPVPLWDEAVEILAPGAVDMNELVSFTAGFDRTMVVSGTKNSGGRRQVIEIQLWSNEELRQQGAVRPSWMDWLENDESRRKEKNKEDPDEKQNVMALLKSLKREADALKRHRALPPKDSRPELIAEMAALQQDTDGAASTIKRGWV